MSQTKPVPVQVAVRPYPEGEEESDSPHAKKRRDPPTPTAMMVLDAETRTDYTQKLTFGSYRFYEEGDCLEEGLFHGDDLPERDQQILNRYAARNAPDVVDQGDPGLLLMGRREFVKKFFRAAYKGRCLVVAFNFPFDISRIACDYYEARKRFKGGFSLGLWSYFDPSGKELPSRYRPCISIKHIDSKRALKAFTGRRKTDKEDRIPEGSKSGRQDEEYVFHGHFLDLRTLAFALTDRGHTLESACEAFGVKHGKRHVDKHGVVTSKYIDYNRYDVRATRELAEKLLEEYGRHPIQLQVTKAYSPASIGKAYLRAMGIVPVLERQPDFPKEYLGYAQTAFYGGRTSAHIRKQAVPVVYTDFLSMYPTVNSLLDLWRFVIAERINIIDGCEAEMTEFLHGLSAEKLFQPEIWKGLTGFAKVVPDGHILPNRARYSAESNDWQVGVNYLYANDQNALWFSLPDLAASVLLCGRVPRIVQAFRIQSEGVLNSLKPTYLRGEIRVDPRTQDFFRVAIEQRKRVSHRDDLSKTEKDRLDKALKVLANAASYGIYAEMNRKESDEKVTTTCHGIDAVAFKPRVSHPDVPGEFCFPPLASLITGSARLMLALLERSVHDRGGTYAMEDTDSMAIVATESGGKLPGEIKALSWAQVRAISDLLSSLNPYDRDAIDGSILKVEKDNHDPLTGNQRQLYCFAISAKRYALFVREAGGPVLLQASCPGCGSKNKTSDAICKKCKRAVTTNNEDDRWSKHGLGHLLNPTDPDSEDRQWIAQTWLSIIQRSEGLKASELNFDQRPAVGRVSVTSPPVIRPLENLNRGKQYPDQIKPFNFLLSCHVRAFGHPLGADPERFHLISPYQTDSREWLKQEWNDQYSAERFRVTTRGEHGGKQLARVKTYSDVVQEYEFHPEAKCADSTGRPCDKQTTGRLQRRHVYVKQIRYIGKESNNLEEVEEGLVHSWESAYTEYPDQRRDYWETVVRPAMKDVALPLLEEMTQISRRAVIYARTGKKRPQPKKQLDIIAVLQQLNKI